MMRACFDPPARRSVAARVLASAHLADRLPMIVQGLRSRHLNVPGGELVNYLVTRPTARS